MPVASVSHVMQSEPSTTAAVTAEAPATAAAETTSTGFFFVLNLLLSVSLWITS